MRFSSLGCLTCLLVSFSTLSWSAERIPARGFQLDLGNKVSKAKTLSKNTLSQSFRLKSKNQFKVIHERKDTKGNTHSRYQQTYMGVPVWGDSLVLHKKQTGKLTASGYIIKGIDESKVESHIVNSAAMEQQAAISLAMDINKHTPDQWTIKNIHAELVIYLLNNSPKLAYKINYLVHPKSIDQKPSRPHMILDAINGKVLKQWEGLTHLKTGTGPGGNEKTGRYEYGTDFGFLDITVDNETCTLENQNVKTINLNHGTSGSEAHSYACPRNTVKEINGAYSPLNDAHFFGNTVFDMFQDWLGVAPLSFQLVMQVHFENDFENAFWDGSAMVFGDGGDMLYPLVDLNIAAHEVSHGFTEQNSNLIYRDQSGGINEAFSDIAGEAAEYYLKGSVDWLVGSETMKNQEAMRYFENPTLDGYSIGHTDDYVDGMDVHESSGVFNRAFYLIANTEGWNVQSAFMIFANANMDYWSANTDFHDGACGVIHAANDLSLNYNLVNDTFKQVGINCYDLPFIDNDTDTMDDNWEIRNGLDPTYTADGPLDLDSDGLSNIEEYKAGTLANNPDTDDDNLGDYEEINTHKTDPTSNDTDQDSMTDDFEIEHNLDPLDGNDGLLDFDNDGYSNTKESKYGTDIFNPISYPSLIEITLEGSGIPSNWLKPDSADAHWVITGDTAGQGNTSLKSQSIDDDQAAIIEFTDQFAEGDISFWAKISSEEGWDYLIITLNGNPALSLTGEQDWAEYKIAVPEGENHIQFIYAKDVIIAEGDDTAWIDHIIYAPQDSDSDGIPDFWEIQHNLNPNNPSDAEQDLDSDGLSNYQEYKLKSDINNTDSDNDLLIDGWEFKYGFNPALKIETYQDPDSDGLDNYQEQVYETNPLNPDTDEDGMHDLWETINNLSPNKNDAALDSDGDNVTNIEEFQLGTNPQKADTDGDGIDDGIELNSRGTSPLNSDSDNDGVNDGQDTYPTDPSRHSKKKDSFLGLGSIHPLFILALTFITFGFRPLRKQPLR